METLMTQEQILEDYPILVRTVINMDKRLRELEEELMDRTTYSSGILISRIDQITYLETFEFQGKDCDRYLVKLREYVSHFYLYDTKNNPPEYGGKICHKIDGEKIVEWSPFI